MSEQEHIRKERSPHVSRAECTLTGYSSTLVRFFEYAVKSPGAITRQDVMGFASRATLIGPVGAKYAGGPAPSTATFNHRIAIISSLYDYAAGFLVGGHPIFDKASPTAGVIYGQPTIKYKYMSESEVHAFLNIIDRATAQGSRDYAIFLLFLTSARRAAAIARLVWADIEENVFEDGHRGHIFKFIEKGGKSVDSQEYAQTAYEALITSLSISGRLESMEPLSPLFLGYGAPHGGLPIDRWKPISALSISHAMKQYLKVAGLPQKYSLHSWRHSSARFRVESGEDIRSVSKILGHQSLATTDRYVSLLRTDADDFGRKLARRFAGER